MASYNKVLLMGNLTKDPELRYSADGTPHASLRMAINRKYKDRQENPKEEVAYVDIKAFGKDAENLSKFVKKGSPLLVDGRLSYYEWQTDGGDKRNKLSVVCERYQFLSNGARGGRAGEVDAGLGVPATGPEAADEPGPDYRSPLDNDLVDVRN
jgi:single-strand DNA-binding protein